MAVTVTDNGAQERYDVHVDGELAGFAQYRRRPGLLAFIHTEIDERFEGRGLGATLVAGALDDARAQGLAVLPFCPFVARWLQRHPEAQDLVPETYRSEFGLPSPAGG